MKIDNKRAIKIITKAAAEYDRILNRAHFLIVYKAGKEINYVEIGFRDMNFLHLTGVKTSVPAQKFYERCLNGKLGEEDIVIDNKGKVAQKLKVLPYLHKLLYNNCMIGEFINSGVMIKADYFVGDTKLVLSVGFRKGKNFDMPVTLYSGDIRKLTNPTNKVLAIFRKVYPEYQYRELTYIAKGFELSQISALRTFPVKLQL